MRPELVGCLVLVGACGLSEYDTAPARTDCVAAPEVPARRLTRTEYVRTVADTLGIDVADLALEHLPDDPKVDGFRNNAFALSVSTQHIDGYWALATAVPARIPDLPAWVDDLAQCRDVEPTCTEGFVAALGRRMFRRPLTPEEITPLLPVFDAADDFDHGATLALSAMLMSPQFLYRLEPAPSPGQTRDLSDHELASRLSTLLWGSSPDPALTADADAGTLTDPAVLSAQVARMLDDPRARAHSRQYFTEWLHLDALDEMVRDDVRYPAFDRGLADQMKQETLDLVDALVWDDLPLMDLLTTEQSWIEPELAALYGLPPQSDPAYDLTDHPERYGILTHASVLAATAHGNDPSIVERGLFVLENVLCGHVDQPPASVDTTLPELGPGAGQRQASQARLDSAACAGCHRQIDPLGYAFERFDAIGEAQTEDPWGNPLIGSGTFVSPAGDAVPFDDVRQFIELLRDSDDVRTCMAQHHLQFALGRPIAADDCALVDLVDTLGPTEPSLREMLTAIALDPSFRRVSLPAGAAP